MHWKNRYFWLSVFCLLVVSLMNVSIALLTKGVIDSLITARIPSFLQAVSWLCGAIITLLLAEYGQQIASCSYLQRMGEYLHEQVVSEIVTKPLYKVGLDYLSKVTNDIEAVKELYYENLLYLFQGMFGLVISSLALFSLDKGTAVFILVLSCMPLLIPYFFKSKLARLQERISKHAADHTVFLSGVLQGLAVLKNSPSLSIFRNLLEGKYAVLSNSHERKNRVSSFGNVLIGLSFYATSLGILWFGGWQVLQGKVTVGSIVAMYTLASELVHPIQLLASSIGDIESSKDLLAEFIGVQETDWQGVPTLILDFQKLEIHGISCQVGEDSPILLKYPDACFEAGKKYLIKGHNGSGKSTLFQLMTANRAYETGEMRLNGCLLEEFAYEQLQSMIAYVPQEPFFFQGSIWNNLTLFQEIDSEMVLDYIERVGLTDRFPHLESLQEQVDGMNSLSGGQRQKLALVRALLQGKPILLLDEGLSALDSQSYGQIEDFLMKKESLTLLHISHQSRANHYDVVYELGSE